jgi:hypothetical protein
MVLSSLDHQTLDSGLDGADLVGQLGGLVGSDRASNHRAGDTGSTAQSHLAGDVDVGNVLVLSKEGQVKDDSQRRSIGGEDDDLGGTAVQGLGSLVGTLLQLTCSKISFAPEVESFSPHEIGTYGNGKPAGQGRGGTESKTHRRWARL